MHTYCEDDPKNLTDKEMRWILKGWMLQETFFQNTQNNLKMRYENECFFLRIQTEIRARLEENPRIAIEAANEIMRKISPKNGVSEWKGEGLSLIGSDNVSNKIEMDFSKPTLFINDKKIGDLPLAIKKRTPYLKAL